tara:strand:- start:33 stop:737 length:705 start_codon:yes stop_codon:yes gene_type:complete
MGLNEKFFASEGCIPPTTGLQLHLDASDTNSYSGSNTTWTDLSGNNNDATLVNMTSSNWNSGGYFNLDGSNEDFSINHSAFSSSSSLTLSAWVNVSDFTSFRSIFSLRSSANSTVKMVVAINTDKTIRFDSASTNDFLTLGATSVANGIPSGQWVLITAIIDYGTKAYRLYRNTDLVLSGTNSNIRNAGDFGVTIFRLGSNKQIQYFKGAISKFRVYDRVLIQDEVDNLYCEGE